MKRSLTFTEIIFLVLVAGVIGAGFLFFYTDLPRFEWYIAEDHLAEWLTVVGLLLGSITCFVRLFRLFKRRRWWFLTVTFLLGLVLFFAAGEEVSWGQRIFHIQSSEYFKDHNAQGETNLHNLVVDGVKLNKLIFSTILSVCLGIYLVIIPILHYKTSKLRSFIDRSGIPVARLYQVISFGLVAGLTALIPHPKSAELLECGAALMLFLIIRFPKNRYVFEK